jgi:hypothetical protein
MSGEWRGDSVHVMLSVAKHLTELLRCEILRCAQDDNLTSRPSPLATGHGPFTVTPPSITSASPVTQADSSLAR